MRALVLEELLEKVQNRFLLAVAAARRARQIKDGSKKLIDAPEDESPVVVALDEILEDKIRIEVGEIVGKKHVDANVTIKTKAAKQKKETKEKAKDQKKTIKKRTKERKKKKSRSMAA